MPSPLPPSLANLIIYRQVCLQQRQISPSLYTGRGAHKSPRLPSISCCEFGDMKERSLAAGVPYIHSISRGSFDVDLAIDLDVDFDSDSDVDANVDSNFRGL